MAKRFLTYPLLERERTVLLLLLLLFCHAQGTLPWILKWAGLESSGQRLISSISKTKRIAFLSCKQFFSLWKFPDFFVEKKWFFEIYQDFLRFWDFSIFFVTYSNFFLGFYVFFLFFWGEFFEDFLRFFGDFFCVQFWDFGRFWFWGEFFGIFLKIYLGYY